MRPTHDDDASSDSESDPDPLDEDDDGMLYTAKHIGNGVALRSRIFPRHSKGITTAPGELGAGETETEADEPVREILTPPPFSILTCFLSLSLHNLAETFAHCSRRTCLRSACPAKYPRTGSHPGPVRGLSSPLHCTRSFWGALQPLPRDLRSLKRKDYSD